MGRSRERVLQSLDIVECVVYTTHVTTFGQYVRTRREERDRELKTLGQPGLSLRRLAAQSQLEPSYLSKIERGLQPPPSEARIVALAAVLGDDPDVLLALAGKVSTDLQTAILRRPALFAELIRELKNQPDHAVLRIVREVRDGTW